MDCAPSVGFSQELLTGVLLAGCDLDVQVANFGFRRRCLVVSFKSKGDCLDHLSLSFVSRIGAAHDSKARNPEAPIVAFGVVSIFDAKSHDHLVPTRVYAELPMYSRTALRLASAAPSQDPCRHERPMCALRLP